MYRDNANCNMLIDENLSRLCSSRYSKLGDYGLPRFPTKRMKSTCAVLLEQMNSFRLALSPMLMNSSTRHSFVGTNSHRMESKKISGRYELILRFQHQDVIDSSVQKQRKVQPRRDMQPSMRGKHKTSKERQDCSLAVVEGSNETLVKRYFFAGMVGTATLIFNQKERTRKEKENTAQSPRVKK